MNRDKYTWHSVHLDKDMSVVVYGTKGTPVLAFPTQSTRFDDWEKNGMVDSIEEFLEAGKIQLFTVGSVDDESWLCENGIDVWRTARQESYYRYIVEEVLPFIRKINKTKKLPIAAGAEIGANQAAVVFLRRPDLFQALIAMSGIYDARYFFGNYIDHDLYENSPERFLENMAPDHEYIQIYNNRKMIFCVGQGAQEFDGVRALKNLERIFITKSINAWCDYWGYDVSHSWEWWCKQIKYFIQKILETDKESEAASEKKKIEASDEKKKTVASDDKKKTEAAEGKKKTEAADEKKKAEAVKAEKKPDGVTQAKKPLKSGEEAKAQVTGGKDKESL